MLLRFSVMAVWTTFMASKCYAQCFIEPDQYGHVEFNDTRVLTNAFAECTSLKSITFNNPLTEVGVAAFEGTGLATLELPLSPEILANAFRWNVNLTSAVVTGDMTAGFAFAGCTKLFNVTFIKVYIGQYSFTNCTSLETIQLPETTQAGTFAFSGSSVQTAMIASTTVSDSAFANCPSLTTVEFEASVKSIGHSAFRGTAITSVETSANIGNFAFANCEDLTTVTLNVGAETIGSNAFGSCFYLTTITLPEGLHEIGAGAFNFTRIAEVTIPSTVTAYGQAFPNVRLTDVTINAPRVEAAFQGSETLTTVSMVNTITIDADAFLDCKSLVAVAMPNTVTEIGSRAFSGCSTLPTIDIPTGIMLIDEATFAHCKALVKIVVPDRVVEIKDAAFQGCISLEEITLSAQLMDVGAQSLPTCLGFGLALASGRNNPRGVVTCVPCTEFTIIPHDVTTIPNFAYAGCDVVEALRLPNTLITVGDHSFSACTALESVSFPVGVSQIGASAFEGCARFQTFTIPLSVVSIQDSTFASCACPKEWYKAGATVCDCVQDTACASPTQAPTQRPTLSPTKVSSPKPFQDLTPEDIGVIGAIVLAAVLVTLGVVFGIRHAMRRNGNKTNVSGDDEDLIGRRD
eukprot:m.202031 g.202031  ORF g.202031 m.202031 type:complete len:632 (-) comp32812_c0_seq1:152-2047(-)